MRKITEQAVRAFRNMQNFKSGNTQVVKSDKGDKVSMLLHGNCIAYNTPDTGLVLDSCDWQTPTTKERLNGLLNNTPCKIIQKDFVWYVVSGSATIPFEDGKAYTAYL